MPRFFDSRPLRSLLIVGSLVTTILLMIPAMALASGPMPMDPPSESGSGSSGSGSAPSSNNGSAGTGQSGSGASGQPGGTGGSGATPGHSANQAPSGQQANQGTSGGAANTSTPQAAITAKPTKKVAPAASKGTTRTPARTGASTAQIESIVELPQPTAVLNAGPIPEGLSSGEPVSSLIETSSAEPQSEFPFSTATLALAAVALALLVVPSPRRMPRPALGSAAHPG